MACGGGGDEQATPTPSPMVTSTPTPGLTPTPQAVTIDLRAQNIRFDKNTITVPAGARVTVVFNHQDSGTRHNFAAYETEAAAEIIFRGEIFRGRETRIYEFTAPTTPGTYFFRCDVHSGIMTGDFIVTG